MTWNELLHGKFYDRDVELLFRNTRRTVGMIAELEQNLQDSAKENETQEHTCNQENTDRLVITKDLNNAVTKSSTIQIPESESLHETTGNIRENVRETLDESVGMAKENIEVILEEEPTSSDVQDKVETPAADEQETMMDVNLDALKRNFELKRKIFELRHIQNTSYQEPWLLDYRSCLVGILFLEV